MFEGFGTVRRYIQAGQYKKAVDMLWERLSGAQASLTYARELVEVASDLRDRTDGRLRRDCDHFVEWGEQCIEKLSASPGEVLRADALAVIAGCIVLGGSGLPPRAGEAWSLIFMADELVLVQGEAIVKVPYTDIDALDIGGPGAQRSGGGFIGGGFGVAGAAEGMLIASALNLLTTTPTTISTVVCLKTKSAELFLHTSSATPNALRMRLSPVFTILRQLEAAQSAGSGPGGDGAVERLTKLADLLEKGLITREEFAELKANVLSGRD